jgi:glycosyltransferase involved in cell wall biosynthesis
MVVGYFGTWERGYPRNDHVIRCLRGAGVEVQEIHAPVWQSEHKFGLGPAVLPRLALAEARLAVRRVAPTVDALIVGYPGQFDLPAAKLHRRPVVFNAMISLYDTFVDDRQRFREGSLPARALRRLDRFAFRSADVLVSDTAANAAAMAKLAGLENVEVCFVGAEEHLFSGGWQQPAEFTALFVGKLIPLHGLKVILDAARLLPNVPFRIVGSGQEEGLMAERPANVEHVPWVEYRDLPTEYASAGCALGIFGTSAKANRVIPNKVFQALATGTPVVTADTAAARELLTHERDALLIPPGDAHALSNQIDRLRRDAQLAARIGAEGRRTFVERASESQLGLQWRAVVERAIAAAPKQRKAGRTGREA